MTTIGKNVYFNGLDDIVKICNNTIYSSIKMKPKDVKNIISKNILKNLKKNS